MRDWYTPMNEKTDQAARDALAKEMAGNEPLYEGLPQGATPPEESGMLPGERRPGEGGALPPDVAALPGDMSDIGELEKQAVGSDIQFETEVAPPSPESSPDDFSDIQFETEVSLSDETPELAVEEPEVSDTPEGEEGEEGEEGDEEGGGDKPSWGGLGGTASPNDTMGHSSPFTTFAPQSGASPDDAYRQFLAAYQKYLAGG